MDFFSSIKNAYDSIGSEISKTFDSSDFEKDSKGGDKELSGASEEFTPVARGEPTEQTSVYATPRGGKEQSLHADDSWGQWEEKTTPTHWERSVPTRQEKATATHQEKAIPSRSVKVESSPVPVPGKDVTDTGVKVPVATSTPTKQNKGKANLENLSKEDLLKYVKKQALLMQKSRAKCEELSRECEELRKHSTPTSDETTPTGGMLEELVIVRSERDKAIGEGKSLQQNLTEMTRENQDLSDRVQALTEANSKLKEFCQECQSEMEGLKQASESMDEERGRLGSEVTQLREEMKTLNQTNQSINQEKDRLKSELEVNNETLTQLRKELEECKECNEAVISERDWLVRELQELNSDDEVTQLRGEVERLKQASQSVTEERNHLREEMEGLKRSDEVARLREEVEKGRQALSDREATIRALSDKVEQLEESTRCLGDEKGRLGSEVDRLTKELEAAAAGERGGEEWRGELERLEGCVAEKTTKAASLESQLTLLTDREHQLKNENESLSAQLSDSNAKIQELESKMQSLEQDCHHVQSQLSEAVDRLGSTQAKLDSVREDKSTLQSLHQAQSVEVEALKHDQAPSESSDQVARLQDESQQLTQTIHELEGQLEKVKGQLEAEKNDMRAELEREKEAHKEESKKLKTFVLKLKKELKEKESTSDDGHKALKEELDQLRVTMETVVGEKEQLLTRLSQEKEYCHDAEQQILELSTQLSAAQRREEEARVGTDQLLVAREELCGRVSSLEENKELMTSELATAQADLATAQSLVNTHQLTVEKLEKDVSSLKEELERVKEAHQGTREQLASAEKGVKASTLMNLELEDYQRSIRSLEGELAGQGVVLDSVRRESQLHVDRIQQLTRELESSGAQKAQEVETVNKLKALLVKNKRELSEARRREGELGERVEELSTVVERGRGDAEEYKVQLSELSARLQSEQQQHQVATETAEATVRGLELKIATLQSQLSSAQASLTIVQGDYDSYKVRVHSVLKQKANAAEQVDISPEIKKQYEEELARLRTDLQTTKAQLSATLTDHEELLSEHDALTTRHDQLLQDTQATRERLALRLKEAESQQLRESREQEELVAQLRREIDKLTSAFTNQIAGLQQEHKKVVVGLREELHSAHSQLSRLQEEADSKVLERTVSQESRGVVKVRKELEVKLGEPPTETRTSGVGMDRSELESSYPSTPLSREDSTVSLERLLSLSSETGGGVGGREGVLQKQLSAAGRKVEHLTELLRESEASSVRLSEQAKLLKEEIRRLERNQEREGVSNMEYLKNVVLKFLHTRDVTEKERLVPVVTKLLQLSPQEVKFVQEAIQGDVTGDGPPGSAVTPQGVGGASKLTNYIHRWTGY